MLGVTEQGGAHRAEGGADTAEKDAPSGEATSEETAAATGASSDASSSGSSAAGQETSDASSGSSGSSESADTTTQRSETAQRSEPAQPAQESSPQGRSQRAPVDVGEMIWKIATILASVVRVAAYVLAVVLVAFIVLTLVGVNPLNAVARVIGGVADTVVLAFRDLFLIADPSYAVVVNYGLAAVFWALVAEFGSRLIRWVAARLA